MFSGGVFWLCNSSSKRSLLASKRPWLLLAVHRTLWCTIAWSLKNHKNARYIVKSMTLEAYKSPKCYVYIVNSMILEAHKSLKCYVYSENSDLGGTQFIQTLRISWNRWLWRPSQPISQIASAQIPLFIGFGASAPIGFLKQGAQLQNHIHWISESHFTKSQ